MFSYFSYSIVHENFVFSFIFQPMQDDIAIWPDIKNFLRFDYWEHFSYFEKDLQAFVRLLIQGVVLLDFFSLIYFYLLLNLG